MPLSFLDDTQDIEPCPLCEQFDFLEFGEAEPTPDNDVVSAFVYSSCCSIQVNAPTLREAIEKWNKLCSCDEEEEV